MPKRQSTLRKKRHWSEPGGLLAGSCASQTHRDSGLVLHEIENHKLDRNGGVVGTMKSKSFNQAATKAHVARVAGLLCVTATMEACQKSRQGYVVCRVVGGACVAGLMRKRCAEDSQCHVRSRSNTASALSRGMLAGGTLTVPWTLWVLAPF